MRVQSIVVRNFRRFTHLKVDGIPEASRLVVVTGVNGSGKSGIIEALNYARVKNTTGLSADNGYFLKTASGEIEDEPQETYSGSAILAELERLRLAPDETGVAVDVQFYEHPSNREAWKTALWVRSAYRHHKEGTPGKGFQLASQHDARGPDRLSAVDQVMEDNFARLATVSVESVFDSTNAKKTVEDLLEENLGALRTSLTAVFPDLTFDGVRDPMRDGTFVFSKGNSKGIRFKNLSAGERAGFDLLLDMFVRVQQYNDTVFCIDEPELHLGHVAQGRLLQALLSLVPENCQIWIATHSPGMMRAALELHTADPSQVSFLDTHGRDFDGPEHMTPVVPTRDFWRRSLEIAMGDLASLVAPSTLVLCEGKVGDGFDAQCYRKIFGNTHPEVEFVSVGNSIEVRRDSQGVAAAVQIIAPGTQILKLVDRDDIHDSEIPNLHAAGTRVLGVRNIEGYLLADDVLHALYRAHGKDEEGAARAIAHRESLMTESGGPSDDYKKVAGGMRVYLKRDLALTQAGSKTSIFLTEEVAPLVRPGLPTYASLEQDLFGSGSAS